MVLVDDFDGYQTRMNGHMASHDLIIKRVFNLNANTFYDGAVHTPSKELNGLTCPLVLRCVDYAWYRLGKYKDTGLSTLIGGLRKTFEFWGALSNV